jgi:hypothetical protein
VFKRWPWASHIFWMDNSRIPKKVPHERFQGIRPVKYHDWDGKTTSGEAPDGDDQHGIGMPGGKLLKRSGPNVGCHATEEVEFQSNFVLYISGINPITHSTCTTPSGRSTQHWCWEFQEQETIKQHYAQGKFLCKWSVNTVTAKCVLVYCWFFRLYTYHSRGLG